MSTGLFSHSAERKIETFQAAQNRQEKAESLTPEFVSDDSIGARNLTKPPLKSKTLSVPVSGGVRESFVSVAPAARPVSERGGDIRSDLPVHNPIPTV